MQPSPKKIRQTHAGEAAIARKYRPRQKYDARGEDVRAFKPKKRLSDGPASRALRVYYIHASATDEEIKALFRPFGNIRFFRREVEKLIAFVVFEKRAEALTAKKRLEHSYPDVVLRASNGEGKILGKAWGGLKIDCVDVGIAQPDSTPSLLSFYRST